MIGMLCSHRFDAFFLLLLSDREMNAPFFSHVVRIVSHASYAVFLRSSCRAVLSNCARVYVQSHLSTTNVVYNASSHRLNYSVF